MDDDGYTYDQQPQRTPIDIRLIAIFIVIIISISSAIGMGLYANGAANDLQNAKNVLLLEVKAHNVTTNQLTNMTTLANERNTTIHQLAQNLTSKTNELATMTTNYNLKNTALANAMVNISHLMGNITNLRNKIVENRTYATFRAFYLADRTNNHSSMNGTYTNESYASDFKINATKALIRCAFVMVFRNNSTTAYINEVNTTTNGTIYLDPQHDIEIAAPVVGHLFNGVNVTRILRVW